MSKCYDNPEFDNQGPEIQNTWKQSIPRDNFDNALESFKESLIKKYEPTLSEKLEKIVSKEPSKFWAESDERFKNKETLEEAAEKRYPFEDGFQVMDIDISEMLQLSFINGAKHQQENSYDKEDMREAYRSGKIYDMTSFDYWFENYKKNKI